MGQKISKFQNWHLSTSGQTTWVNKGYVVVRIKTSNDDIKFKATTQQPQLWMSVFHIQQSPYLCGFAI